MRTITLQLPDAIAEILDEEAEKSGLSLETFAAGRLLDAMPDRSPTLDDILVYKLIDQIVEENTELYKRLA